MRIRDSPAKCISNPEEEALYLFCKQILKSKLFKGFYTERCYIDNVKDYRDKIIINPNEKELKAILGDMEERLRKFYSNKSSSMWIGITGTMNSVAAGSLTETCLWVELEELAFGKYWFIIKSARWRDNEIILKIKPVRPVEEDPVEDVVYDSRTVQENNKLPDCIGLQDFIEIVLSWGTTTKRIIYEFMSNDISKENLAALFRFLILVCISLFSFSIEATRFLGIFLIRFMMEFRKILVVSTPIIIRIIDLCGKIIGGFYLLLAMVWRDSKKGGAAPKAYYKPIEYNRPIYQSIKNDKLSQNNTFYK